MRASLHVIAGRGSGQLATIAHPRGDDWEADELGSLAGSGVSVLVSALTTAEQQRLGFGSTSATAARLGVDFLPFPVGEGGIARDDAAKVVGLAGRLAAQVSAGRFVVTQCFAGIGRSTLLAGATLVMLGIGPERALELLTVARGLPVPDTEAQRDWLYQFALNHGG